MPASPHSQAQRPRPGEPRSKGKRGLVGEDSSYKEAAHTNNALQYSTFCLPLPPEIGAEIQYSTSPGWLSRPQAENHTSNREIREIGGEHPAPEPLGGAQA